MFISALFTTVKTWKQTKCPSTDEWIQKIWYTHMTTCIHIYMMEYYLTIKNKIKLFAATWMDLEIITISKEHQRQIYEITYMWNLIK